MADETANIALRVDASGMRQGVEEAARLGQKLIDTNKAIEQSATETARKIAEPYSGQTRFLDGLARKIDPLGTAAKKAQADLDRLNGVIAAGGKKSAEALALLDGAMNRLAEAQKAAAGSHDAVALSSGQASFAQRQFAVQTVQLISSIQAGQPVLTAFIQQGHQVADVALSTGQGFGAMGQMIGGMFTGAARWAAANPLVVIGAAGGAALVALGVAAEGADRRVERLRNILSGVRPDFVQAATAADRAARELAASSSLSLAETRGGINAVFANGVLQISEQRAKEVTLAFANLSKVLDEAEPNWGRMTEAMRAPGEVLQRLLDQNHLAGVSQTLVNQVKLLEAAGDRAGAFALVLDAVVKASANVAENKTPLGKALVELSNAFTAAGENGKTFAERIGVPIVNAAASAVSGLNDLIQTLERFETRFSALSRLGDAFRNAVNPLGASWNDVTGLMNWLGLSGASGSRGGVSGVPAAGTAEHSTMTAVRSFFASKGLSDAAIAGVLANIAAESGFNPGARGDSGTSFGLFQHHNERMSGLFAASGTQTPSVSQQLDFAWSELTGKYSNVLRALQNATDPYRAAMAFSMGFENPAGGLQTAMSRGGLANQFIQSSGGTASAGLSGLEFGITPSGVVSRSGIANIPGRARDQALETAKALGAVGFAEDEARAKAKLLGQALTDGTLSPADADKVRDALRIAGLAAYNAIEPVAKLAREMGIQAAQNDALAAGWNKGALAAALVTARINAQNEALKIAAPGTAAYGRAVEVLTAANIALAASQERAKLAEANDQTRSQIELLKLDAATLLMDADARQRILDHRRNEIDVMNQFRNLSEAERAVRVAALDQLSAQTRELERMKAGVNALADVFSQSFDTIGNAMAQAFVQGQGAAVNWRNVMTAVVQQVIQHLMKLAVLNPILNELFGGDRPTLASSLNAMASAGSSGSAGLFGRGIAWLGNQMGGGDALAGIGGWNGADAVAVGVDSLNASGVGMFGMIGAAHSGWHVGMTPPPSARFIHPAYFDDAPRLHGGLMPDEFPAILQRGELVVPRELTDLMGNATRRPEGRASGGNTINIVMNAPQGGDRDTFRWAANQIGARVSVALNSAATSSHR